MAQSLFVKLSLAATVSAISGCATAPDVARNDAFSAVPFFADSAIPATELSQSAPVFLDGGDLSVSVETVEYVGEDSSIGPVSGFTPPDLLTE